MFTSARNSLRTQSASFKRFYSQIGESIPSVGTLREGSPGNKVELSELTSSGKSLIVGVPGAFSPACSSSHIPGYIQNYDTFKSKGYDKIFVTGVNDAFVFKAWSDELLKDSSSLKDDIRFIADPSADFAKSVELAIDATGPFGGIRDKRFVLVVNDGKVVKEISEPDNFGVDVTAAEKVLKELD